MPRPRPKPAPPECDRWFVLSPQGEIYDGPFRLKASANKAAEEFRDRFGEEPSIVQDRIRPVAASYSSERARGKTDDPAL